MKLYKYTKKIINNYSPHYANKIIQYLKKNNIIDTTLLSGGNSSSVYVNNNTYDLETSENFFNFIKAHIDTTQNNTTHKKYLVLTYGPPGSGKTLANKIICHYIKKYNNEENSIDKIYKSFVYCGVDDITYIKKYKNKEGESGNFTVKQKLIEKLDEYTKGIDVGKNCKERIINFINNISQERYNDLTRESYSIYYSNRADIESETLLFYSALFGKNLIMEFATYTERYFKSMINGFCNSYTYIPVIVYPFMRDIKKLFLRTLNRGFDEGRFVNNMGDYKLRKIAENDLGSLDDILKITKPSNNYIFLMYDSDLDETDRNEYNDMNKFMMTEFEKKYLLFFKCKTTLLYTNKEKKEGKEKEIVNGQIKKYNLKNYRYDELTKFTGGEEEIFKNKK